MLVKIAILIFMLMIALSLGLSLFFLIKEGEQSKRFAHTMVLRVGLSASVLIALLVAFSLHGLQPHWL